jgi:hypothetical protein
MESLFGLHVPFCGIPCLPQIVTLLAATGPAGKISIKKDRNFLILGKTPIGIPVV